MNRRPPSAVRRPPGLALVAVVAAVLTGCNPDPCDKSGAICTVMGGGNAGLASEGALAEGAPLYWPSDVTVGPDGDPWILDWNNHRIITLVPGDDGPTVHVVTGNAIIGDGPFDGPASQAHWNHPTNVRFLDDHTFLFAAWHNSRVVGLDVAADSLWLEAGTGGRDFGGDGGPAVDAIFDLPSSIDLDDVGNLYVSDQANQRIRMISPDGTIETCVGDGEPGFGGDGGPALSAELHSDRSQNAEPAGRLAVSDGKMVIADTDNQRIRIVDLETMTIDTLAGTGDKGVGVDGDALSTEMKDPRDVAFGPDGAVYYADSSDHCVRKVLDGAVTTVAGVCGEKGYDGDGGDPLDAHLDKPYGIDVADDGTIWIADTDNHALRRVNPAE